MFSHMLAKQNFCLTKDNMKPSLFYQKFIVWSASGIASRFRLLQDSIPTAEIVFYFKTPSYLFRVNYHDYATIQKNGEIIRAPVIESKYPFKTISQKRNNRKYKTESTMYKVEEMIDMSFNYFIERWMDKIKKGSTEEGL